MKKRILMVTVSLSLAATVAIAALPKTVPPPTLEIETSAGNGFSVTTSLLIAPHAFPKNAGNPNIRIITHPIRMVLDKNDPAYGVQGAAAIEDAIANSVRTTHSSDPNSYDTAPVIASSDLISSPGARGLWLIVEGFSPTGADDVSMADITVALTSLNDGGALNATVGFADSSYTPLAVLVMQDGSRVTSGPATQKGQRVFLLVRFKTFDGSTPSNVSIAQNWIANHPPYGVMWTAQGNADSAVWRTVSMVAPFDDGRFLILDQTNNASGLAFSVSNNYSNRFCTVWGRGDLSAPKKDWYPDDVAYDTSSGSVVPYYAPARYFSAELQ